MMKLKTTLHSAIFALLFSIPPVLSADLTSQNPEKDLNTLSKDKKALQGELKADRDQQTKVQNELRKQEVEISNLTKKIQALNEKIKLQEKELAKQVENKNKTEAEINKNRTLLAENLRAIHATGESADLKFLLNQDDTIEVQRLLTYHSYFNQELQLQIESLAEQLTEHEVMSKKVAETKKNLDAERTKQQSQQARLKKQQQERNTLLTSLEKSISDKDKQLQELIENEEALQRILKETQKAAANTVVAIPPAPSGPFSSQRGKLLWPTRGQITHRFGSVRAGGQSKYDGVVISAPTDQAVYAVYPGRVVYADWLRGFGLLVIIDHGNSYMSLYAHNNVLLQKTGAAVKAGEQIATVGTTGGLRESGLYFEIRHSGKPLDPQPWLGTKVL